MRTCFSAVVGFFPYFLLVASTSLSCLPYVHLHMSARALSGCHSEMENCSNRSREHVLSPQNCRILCGMACFLFLTSENVVFMCIQTYCKIAYATIPAIHAMGWMRAITRHAVCKCWPPRNLVIRHGCLFPISSSHSVKTVPNAAKRLNTEPCQAR